MNFNHYKNGNKDVNNYLLLDLLHFGLVFLGCPISEIKLDAIADIEDNIC